MSGKRVRLRDGQSNFGVGRNVDFRWNVSVHDEWKKGKYANAGDVGRPSFDVGETIFTMTFRKRDQSRSVYGVDNRFDGQAISRQGTVVPVAGTRRPVVESTEVRDNFGNQREVHGARRRRRIERPKAGAMGTTGT